MPSPYLNEGDHFARLDGVHHHAAAPGDQGERSVGREAAGVARDHMLANAVCHQFAQPVHHEGMRARVVEHDDGAVLEVTRRDQSEGMHLASVQRTPTSTLWSHRCGGAKRYSPKTGQSGR